MVTIPVIFGSTCWNNWGRVIPVDSGILLI
jgi:hypothetical protein